MGQTMKTNSTVMKIAQTALFAALCYVIFTYLQIKIPMPGGDATSIHLGNAFCVLAALLLGGWYGGLAGAIGMGIADVMDPIYITGAPKTFILKLCIGLITGLVAHKIAKINESTDKKYIFKWSLLASVAGLAFNVIADPIVGYFYKQYILGQPQQMAEVLAKWSAATTFVNAILSTIVVVIIYNALRPALAKSGMLSEIVCYGPFDRMPENLLDNVYWFGGWECRTPGYTRAMEVHGIINPYRDVVNNENIYLVDDNIDLTLKYIRQYYAENAQAVFVKTIGNVDVYQITDDSVKKE